MQVANPHQQGDKVKDPKVKKKMEKISLQTIKSFEDSVLQHVFGSTSSTPRTPATDEQKRNIFQPIYRRIMDVTTQAVHSFRPECTSSTAKAKNRYGLFSVDILLDGDLNPMITDFNVFPACRSKPEWLGDYFSRVTREAVDIVTEVNVRQTLKLPLHTLQSASIWEMIVNDAPADTGALESALKYGGCMKRRTLKRK